MCISLYVCLYNKDGNKFCISAFIYIIKSLIFCRNFNEIRENSENKFDQNSKENLQQFQQEINGKLLEFETKLREMDEKIQKCLVEGRRNGKLDLYFESLVC